MSSQVEMNEYGKQRYFDKYYDGDGDRNRSENCCIKCLKKCTKKIAKQLFKLFIFFSILGGLAGGIYWGTSEIIALNNFNQVPSGCRIVSFVGSVNGTDCSQCDCEYLYNPWSLSRSKVCTPCSGLKYNYLVTAEACGTELLSLDNDYYDDLACGNAKKIVGDRYDCYLYGDDCRGQYSFDTMYADQNQLMLPIMIIVICSILFILVLLLKCLCC